LTVPSDAPPEDWFWEGHVQKRLRAYFVTRGWSVISEADCLKRERGIDLHLGRDGHRLAIEVKGFPSATYARGSKKGQPKRTSATLQAKHWFAEALLSAILCQALHPDDRVAIAFPDFPRYQSLIDSTRHALEKLEVGVFLVRANGTVVAVVN
jgi:hypothetical protein